MGEQCWHGSTHGVDMHLVFTGVDEDGNKRAKAASDFRSIVPLVCFVKLEGGMVVRRYASQRNRSVCFHGVLEFHFEILHIQRCKLEIGRNLQIVWM